MRVPQSGPIFREVAYGVLSKLERVKTDLLEGIYEANKEFDFLVSADGWWSPIKTRLENHSCLPFLIFNQKEIRDDTIKITSGPSNEELRINTKEADEDTKTSYMTVQSLREAAVFVKGIVDGHGLHPSRVPIFYSGKRGCHITIDPILIEMIPSQLNRGIVAHFANQMRHLYDFKTVDMEIYRKSHYMLRVADSLNTETGRFCVQFSLEEALKIDYPTILRLSSEPRGQVYGPRKDEFVSEEFKEIWKSIEKQYIRLDDLAKLRPIKPISDKTFSPPCHDVFVLKGADFFNSSDRQEAYIIARGSFDRDVGVPREKSAEDIITGLTGREADEKTKRVNASVARSMLDIIYGSDAHHFSCSFMRMLTKDPTVDIPLCEEGKFCLGINPEDQQIAHPPEVTLDRAVDPRWRGQRLLVNASLCGISYQPTTAPRTTVIKCPANIKICEKCPASPFMGRMVKNIPPYDPLVLKASSIGREKHPKCVEQWLKIPTVCKSHEIIITDEYTCYDLSLVPTIRMTAEFMDKDVPFVSRMAVLVDSGTIEGLKLETSREYLLTAYPNGGPIDPKIILQIVDAKPSEDRIDQFQMTKDLHESLKVFQPSEGQSCKDKWRDIYDDLAANALHIYERADAFFCCDLIYHSLTANFRFGDDHIDRAYCEALIIGDTGQGKTTLAKRLIAHYGLGLFCSGETAKRTGLLYTVVQAKGAGEWFIHWGILPMNDRRLVFVDEFAGVKAEDKEILTGVRSSGIVEVAGAARGKTQARTRIIFMTNSPDSKYINQHNFGCDVVSQVFRKPEDVRRLDIANTLSINEINRSDLSRLQQMKEKPEHKYTSIRCNKLVLWAWSRKAEQVEFTPEAVKAVYSAVEYLNRKYVQEIPLLLAEDLTNKVARGSAAIAARHYSTKDGEILIVTEEHVNTWVWLIDSIYSKKTFGFLSKSTIMKNSRRKTIENIEVVKEFIRNIFKSNGNLASFCENLMGQATFSKSDLCEVFPDDGGFAEFFKLLKTSRMIERSNQYWVKTEVFTDLIKGLLDDASWEEASSDDAAEVHPEPAGAESTETADLFGESARD